MLAMWLSTVRKETETLSSPQMPSRKSSRVRTWPLLSTRSFNMWNSRGVKSIFFPFLEASNFLKSRSIPPKLQTSGSRCLSSVRRKTAFTRAVSARGRGEHEAEGERCALPPAGARERLFAVLGREDLISRGFELVREAQTDSRFVLDNKDLFRHKPPPARIFSGKPRRTCCPGRAGSRREPFRRGPRRCA